MNDYNFSPMGSDLREFADAQPEARYNAARHAVTKLELKDRLEIEEMQETLKKKVVNMGNYSANELLVKLGLWLKDNGYG